MNDNMDSSADNIKMGELIDSNVLAHKRGS